MSSAKHTDKFGVLTQALVTPPAQANESSIEPAQGLYPTVLSNLACAERMTDTVETSTTGR
jgi:hypothetical protein